MSFELSKIENITKATSVTLKNSNIDISTKYTYNSIKLQSYGIIKLQKIQINL